MFQYPAEDTFSNYQGMLNQKSGLLENYYEKKSLLAGSCEAWKGRLSEDELSQFYHRWGNSPSTVSKDDGSFVLNIDPG